MNILGCLSYPYTYHFDHFGAFLTYFGVFKKFANYGLKTKEIDFGIHHIQIQHHQIILKTLDTDFYPKMPGEVPFSDF